MYASMSGFEIEFEIKLLTLSAIYSSGKNLFRYFECWNILTTLT